MLGIKLLTSVLLATTSTTKDAVFTDWCRSLGIEPVSTELRTTPESVAGRGLFALKSIEEGQVVLKIPETAVLHNYNAAKFFPETAGFLQYKRNQILKQFQKHQRWWDLRNLWRRGRRNPEMDDFEFVNPHQDLWQMELTLFALDVMEGDSLSPWAQWVSEWYRDDPMHDLHEKGVKYTEHGKVRECVADLSSMLPEADTVKLNAAVDLRLRRLNALKSLYDVQDVPQLDKWYSLLISRAVEVGDGVAACIPMFDMINHSYDPNLVLSFDGTNFALIACQNIEENEEVRFPLAVLLK
jgi:hypothetical protein